MSHKESKVDQENGLIDIRYCSGDSKNMRSKSKQQYQEENNNEIDELSKDLSNMGCIVDKVKPPNICVETCVYDGSDSDGIDGTINEENEEDAYSDEFEEEKSDAEDGNVELKSAQSDSTMARLVSPALKLSNSHSFSSIKQEATVSRKSSYGSISVPPTRRINMSFTNDRLREIERHNHILLKKILSARGRRRSSIPAAPRADAPPRPRDSVPSAPAAVHRRRQQRQIEHDNMILLKKIQGAKSSSYSIRR